MQFIKDFFWFMKESKSYMGKNYSYLIFKESAIKKAIWFALKMRHSRKMSKKYGADVWYAIENKVITFD